MAANSFSGEEPFSSFTSLAPIGLQKTFILPKGVTTMHRTLTKYGLANKNILMGTTSGQIQSIDLRFIHPRRPMADPSSTEKEEGLQKYAPYLHFPASVYVSHNVSVAALSNIVSATSQLESTSLILAYGLDVFFNHHKPSQSFDVLSSDFNRTFLILILTALALALVILRSMSRRKTLNSYWA